MKALMIRPLLSRIFAVFRCPELGFLGFVTPTLRQTPFISGRPTIAGLRERRFFCGLRQPLRTWLRVAEREGVVVKDRKCVWGVPRGGWIGTARRAGAGEWIGRDGRMKERSARRVRMDGARDILIGMSRSSA